MGSRLDILPVGQSRVEPGRKLPAGYNPLAGIFEDPGAADCVSGQRCILYHVGPNPIIWFEIRLDGSEWLAFKNFFITDNVWRDDTLWAARSYLTVDDSVQVYEAAAWSWPVCVPVEARKILFGPGVVRLLSQVNPVMHLVQLNCSWSAWRGRSQAGVS